MMSRINLSCWEVRSEFAADSSLIIIRHKMEMSVFTVITLYHSVRGVRAVQLGQVTLDFQDPAEELFDDGHGLAYEG